MIALFQQNESLFLVSLFLIGACVGSFLNVVIYRLPRSLQQQWSRQCQELLEITATDSENTAPGIAYPPSFCPSCKTPIKAWHNLPILGYIFLKGRCNSCNVKIPARYPVIETFTALLTVFLGLKFGLEWKTLFALVLAWSLITLTFIDIDHHLLPDNITLPLMWLGLIANLNGIFTSLHSAVIGAIAGYMCLWILYQIHFRLTGKEGMGYGDFKLLAALGAWFGWSILAVVALIASLSGTIFAVWNMIFSGSGKNMPIAFGPFLALSGLVILLWGDIIIERYLTFFLLA